MCVSTQCTKKGSLEAKYGLITSTGSFIRKKKKKNVLNLKVGETKHLLALKISLPGPKIKRMQI